MCLHYIIFTLVRRVFFRSTLRNVRCISSIRRSRFFLDRVAHLSRSRAAAFYSRVPLLARLQALSTHVRATYATRGPRYRDCRLRNQSLFFLLFSFTRRFARARRSAYLYTVIKATSATTGRGDPTRADPILSKARNKMERRRLPPSRRRSAELACLRSRPANV